MSEDAVEESPLLSRDQREILRSLLEHSHDGFAPCLEDLGTVNYQPFQIKLEAGSKMMRSKPNDLRIVTNEILRRELERQRRYRDRPRQNTLKYSVFPESDLQGDYSR